MTKHINRLAAGSVALAALLSLAACVTPQIQKTTVAPAPMQATKVVNALPAIRTSTETVIASRKLQELLEAQLICPGKGTLAIALTRATAMSERVIGRQGKDEGDGSTAYTVVGDLAVYGLKVTALRFSGNDDDEGASIMAVVKATNAEVSKVYKSKHINISKSHFGPGLWAKRPFGLVTGVYEAEGLRRMGCVAPID